jgi:hypothetical protein
MRHLNFNALAGLLGTLEQGPVPAGAAGVVMQTLRGHCFVVSGSALTVALFACAAPGPLVPSPASSASVAAQSAAPGSASAFAAPLASSSPAASSSAAAPSVASAVPPSAEGKTAVDIVSRLPDVKRYCASLERAQQPSHCAMWSEDENAPTTRCASNASFLDDCLWPVYLGESQPDHTVRYATLWVNLTARTVTAVSDWACGRMPASVWRAWRAKVSATPDKPPDCPSEAR